MPISHPTLLPPVRTAEELTARWRLLLADRPTDDDPATDPEQARNDLWVLSYDADGVQQPALIVVEDVPDLPEGPFAANLAAALSHHLAEETAAIGAVAFGLSPAGRHEVSAADLRWATELSEACAAEGVRVLGVHLVADDEVHRVG